MYSCQENLKVQNRNSFGHARHTLTKTLRDLKAAEDEYRTNPDRVYKLRDTIKKLKKREEYIWKQRLRTTWLKEGDQNSRYFHCSANQMKKKKKGILFQVCMMGAVVERYFQSMSLLLTPQVLKKFCVEFNLLLKMI